MAVQAFLKATIFDEEAKQHINDRHIREWSGKSTFIVEKAEVYSIILDIVEDARVSKKVEATYTDQSGMQLKTVILRKTFTKDVGLSMFNKEHKVRSVYVILVNEKVKTAYPADETRSHNGLMRTNYSEEERYEDDEDYEREEDYELADSYENEDFAENDYDDEDFHLQDTGEVLEAFIPEELWA